jgi:hypothetical protein
LLYSVAAIGNGILESRRLDRALAELRTCLAKADKPCANAELETARELRRADHSVALGEAGVRIVLGELDRAEALASDVERRERSGELTLDAPSRGDLLLVRGDIAAARNNRSQARAIYASAELLVTDRRLVSIRMQRLDALDKADATRATTELDAMEADFAELFDAAGTGKREVTGLTAAKASDWLGRVTHEEARRQLALAIDAAWKACTAAESRQRDEPWSVPRDPPRPPEVGSFSYSYSSYAARKSQYDYELKQYERQKARDDDRRRKHDDDAANTTGVALREGRDLVASSLRTLRAITAPLSDASVPRTPSTVAVPGYRTYPAGPRFWPGMRIGNIE